MTRIKKAVFNASPLICLDKAGLADLPNQLFREVVIPRPVFDEVMAGVRKDKKAGYEAAWKPYLRAIGGGVDARVAAWDLGEGESAVLTFAVRHPEYWAVLDDAEARRCASVLGCHRLGTLGILVLAKRRGILPSLEEAIERIKKAGLWVSPELIREICAHESEA